MRIALATSKEHPQLTQDDRTLLEPLADRGFQPEPVVWTDETVRWENFDAVLIRSCWDYHLRHQEFLRWIGFLEEIGVPVWNPPRLLRWNTDKIYLRSLELQGIAVVPTFWSGPKDVVNLLEKMLELEWDRAVIKPRISATAHCTQLVSREDARDAQVIFDQLRTGPGVMLQKFMGAITDEGEWSLIFFGTDFSHAVIKQPKAGDFRVQKDFGGTRKIAQPPEFAVRAAQVAIDAVRPTLYARVDGVVDGGQFLLMELELIEPELFLTAHTNAAERLADAIADTLRKA
jgi:glutathione synthase/RimK-type ligase-like ATP-grasp enzyme